jgi:hypothetical protein
VKHSSGKTDIEFENMDFLELTSSESINGNEYGVH